jgi:prepilin-type N-terminal cleavage/methylation domain-containing protein
VNTHARRQQGLTLIEVMVVTVILGIVSTLLVLMWANLQRAYSFTVSSNQSRQQARDSMARMVAEIRDAQIPTSGPYAGQAPIRVASGFDIRFFTSYGQSTTESIVLTRYRYRLNSATGRWTLYRQRDTNGNGILDSSDLRQVVTTLCVNQDPTGDGNLSDRVDMFTYSYYDTNGNLVTTGATYGADGNSVSGTTSVPTYNLSGIETVNIRIISDLNPRRAPVYIDLRSTVQPRNLRQE